MKSKKLMGEPETEEASHWIGVMRSTAITDQQREIFSDWLSQSSTNMQKYMELSGMSRRIGQHLLHGSSESESQNAVPTRHGFQFVGAAFRRLIIVRFVVVALILCTIGHEQRKEQVVRTEVGELRTTILQDKSVVTLNSDSAVRIHISGSTRRVEMSRGEAVFIVTENRHHPFIVETRDAQARVLGTEFKVRVYPERTGVTVVRGRVEVTAKALASRSEDSTLGKHLQTGAVLADGASAAVTTQGAILRVKVPPLESVIARLDRRLRFNDASLVDVIAEFNRHNNVQLRLQDPANAQIKINGTFDPCDTSGFAHYLTAFLGVTLTPELKAADSDCHH